MDGQSDSKSKTRYRRVLLKLSGESLMGKQSYGIDHSAVRQIASEIAEAVAGNVQICLVIGGGNIFRGLSAAEQGMDRATADYMGMLATIMNALAMQNALENLEVETRVQSAIPMMSVCEPYIRRKAIRHMERGRTVIFAAGTGNPFFTTDTGAALRAAEMACDALLKGTQVDGVYSADPKHNPDAVRYDNLDYDTVLAKNLRVMDASAVAMMRDNNIPIIVYSNQRPGNLQKVLAGSGVCTVIGEA